jgi:2-methylisocitrate lyase-like PEP mutase family enzyme
MIIYANQTLRVSHLAITKLLREMINAEHISDVKEEMSTMQDIFNLQEMFSLKEKEKELENQLKKLGYIS